MKTEVTVGVMKRWIQRLLKNNKQKKNKGELQALTKRVISGLDSAH